MKIETLSPVNRKIDANDIFSMINQPGAGFDSNFTPQNGDDILHLATSHDYSEIKTEHGSMPFDAALGNTHYGGGSQYITGNDNRLSFAQFELPSGLQAMVGHEPRTAGLRPRAMTMQHGQGMETIHHGFQSYPDLLPSIEQSVDYSRVDGDDFGDDIDYNVPSMDNLMNPLQTGMDISTRFASLEAANAWRPQTFNIPQDRTIPTTIEQKRALVKAMYKAMRSIEFAEDNEGMIKPFRERKHNGHMVEAACWKILVSLAGSSHLLPIANGHHRKVAFVAINRDPSWQCTTSKRKLPATLKISRSG
jgi:hypothetical protein